MNLKQTFAALKYRNYKLWFWGQMVSMFGSWMQITAQSFLVYELTKSPAYLGYVSFASGLPSWIFLLYGGVIADRMPKRTLLLITQTCMMCLAWCLAAVTFLGVIQPWHIVIFSLLLGAANAFDAPARQAFVMELVGREDLSNAIALNSTLFNCAVLIGPAAAGAVYMALGPAWCFSVNGITFVAIITSLLLIKTEKQAVAAQNSSAMESLVEGLRYAMSNRLIRTIILFTAVICLFGFSFATLMPAWAVSVLGGDAATNGLLQSARGFGALISALLIASLGRFKFKGRLLTAGTFVFPVMLLIFAEVRSIALSLCIMVCVGISLIMVLNLSNVLLQAQVVDHLRGRVMSIFSLTHFGLMPVGGLLAGLAAEHIGSPATIIASCIISLVCAVFVYMHAPQIRKLE